MFFMMALTIKKKSFCNVNVSTVKLYDDMRWSLLNCNELFTILSECHQDCFAIL